VLAELAAKQKAGLNPDPFLLRASGQSFYNTSPMDMGKLILFDFDKPARTSPLRFQPWLAWRASSSPT
jgi:hypothetical protein